MEDGSLKIACKKGLWGVRGHDHSAVEQEAKAYWWKYFSDGEYDSPDQSAKPTNPSHAAPIAEIADLRQRANENRLAAVLADHEIDLEAGKQRQHIVAALEALKLGRFSAAREELEAALI
jgi:23S rRNA A1618 N6-methylase RlmF